MKKGRGVKEVVEVVGVQLEMMEGEVLEVSLVVGEVVVVLL